MVIYCTIGTMPFPRLQNALPLILEAADRDFVSFPDKPVPRAEHARRIQQASVVVCHAGAGTILQCWEAKKVPVVVPRLKQYGEHVDDHQLEFTKALEAYGLVIPVYDVKDLPEAIKKAKTMKFPDMEKGDLAEQVDAALKEVL